MVTGSGQIKVLDFGVAKRLDLIADQGSTVAATIGTEAGVAVGTLAYMSPEQARGLPVDARSDVFSLGAVMYEMLTGRRAFAGGTTLVTLAAILGEHPPRLEEIRPDVPAALSRLVHDCLEKDVAKRPPASEVAKRLAAMRHTQAASSITVRSIMRRRTVVMPAAALLVAAALGGWWWWNANARVRWARAAAPRIQQLVDRDDFQGAYELARDAVAILPDDPPLKQLWSNVTFPATIDSTPPGADVAVKTYLADDTHWTALGRTPLEGVRVPFGQVRVRVTKEGFAPFDGTLAFKTTYVLDRPAAIPPGMVRVPAAAPDVLGTAVRLDDFWMDRYEVTNREFKAFVDRGGYRTPAFWTQPFVDGSRTLSWTEAMARFRDTTGRPGPAAWDLSAYPDGQDDLPVTGVSWYEAAAYAASVQKNLPTAFHWRGAAGLYGFTANFADILHLSNFGGKGPATVGSSRAISPFGTYDMAGNVKEWCWNEARGGRMILGGAWNEARYMFQDYDAQSPFERLPTNGVRLAKYIAPPPPASLGRIETRYRDYTKERPVSDEVFEVLRGLYRYDPRPLNARVEAAEGSPWGRKETITFDAAQGSERVRAYLYLPKNARPPYQTVIYFPGGDATVLRSSRDLNLSFVDFVIRSGRALLFPVWAGTYERGVAMTGPNAARDVTIARGKDLGRVFEYLDTREDIDRDRVAFYGLSLGAFTGVILTALEPRFKASVLMGGGVSSILMPPEIDQINFAPRIHVPTLIVTGREDFAHPLTTEQAPLFRLLGCRPEDKHHAILEGGHIPVRMHEVIRVILDWFDRYLGPVTVTG
jgi:dienelactone hydrolase